MTRTEPPRAAGTTALARVLALLALVVACSGTASAHETPGGGSTVGFGVVVALPVLAGLAGGLAAVSRRADAIAVPHVGTAFGVALVALGTTFLVHAAGDAPLLSVVLVVAGGVAARTLLGHTAVHRGADAALAAVAVHRFVEGTALAVAYGVGAAVGAFGAVALAGHAVVESVIIGRLHARIGRPRALAAVVGVQASFVLGARIGADAVLSSVHVRAAVLAVAGGVLLVLGFDETGATGAVDRWLVAVRRR